MGASQASHLAAYIQMQVLHMRRGKKTTKTSDVDMEATKSVNLFAIHPDRQRARVEVTSDERAIGARGGADRVSADAGLAGEMRSTF